MYSARKTISVITLLSLFLSTICPAAMASSAPEPLSISQKAFDLPDAKVGVTYEYLFQNEGGLAPFTWRVAQGELPPGLKLEPNGQLHGVPSQAHRDGFSFQIEVTDSSRTPQKATMPILLMVQAAPLKIVTSTKLKIITTPTGPANDVNNSSNNIAPVPTNTNHSTEPKPQQTGTGNPQRHDGLTASLNSSNNVTMDSTTVLSAAAANDDACAVLLAAPTPTPTPTPAPTPMPNCLPPNCVSGKNTVCGRLRPASMDQTLALILSIPSFRNYLKAEEAKEQTDQAQQVVNIKNAIVQKWDSKIAMAPANDPKLAQIQECQEKAKKDAEDADKILKEKDKAEQIAEQKAQQPLTQKKIGKAQYDIDRAYLPDLWKRVAKSRFISDVDCRTQSVAPGAQKDAVVELFEWVLEKWNEDEVKNALGDDSIKLTKEIIRKQIILLNSYIGNVRVIVKKKNASVDQTVANTLSDRDGNFVMTFGTPAKSQGSSANPAGSAANAANAANATSGANVATAATVTDNDVYEVSSEADNHHTRREIKFFDECQCYKLNLEVEDRPASLLARAVVGYQQAGSASTEAEQNYFFDLYISKSLPWRQKLDPDFGEAARVWGAIRSISVPQTGEEKLGTFASGFVTRLSDLPVKDAARVFDYLGGLELRLLGNNALMPSFDRQTKQKFSLSFIVGGGFVTPATPLETVRTYNLPAKAELDNNPDLRKALNFPTDDKKYVTFLRKDRDRFYRQYYAGFRMQTFFFNRHNIPLQRFPAQLDITVGQNEFVSGGQLRGPVVRLDGYFPLPYEGAKFINLFGTAVVRPVPATERTPLILAAAKDADGNAISPTDPLVHLIPVSQFNRDYYRVGVGIEFILFVRKLLGKDK